MPRVIPNNRAHRIFWGVVLPVPIAFIFITIASLYQSGLQDDLLAIPAIMIVAFLLCGLQSTIYSLIMEYWVNPFCDRHFLPVFISGLLGGLASMSLFFLIDDIKNLIVLGFSVGITLGVILRINYMAIPISKIGSYKYLCMIAIEKIQSSSYFPKAAIQASLAIGIAACISAPIALFKLAENLLLDSALILSCLSAIPVLLILILLIKSYFNLKTGQTKADKMNVILRGPKNTALAMFTFLVMLIALLAWCKNGDYWRLTIALCATSFHLYTLALMSTVQSRNI